MLASEVLIKNKDSKTNDSKQTKREIIAAAIDIIKSRRAFYLDLTKSALHRIMNSNENYFSTIK